MLLVTAVFVLVTVIVLRRSRVVDPSDGRRTGIDARPRLSVARRGITRRRLLVAAGTVLAAPGCVGGGSSAPPPETAHPRAARLTGPLRVLAPAGAVPAANRLAFAQAAVRRRRDPRRAGGPRSDIHCSHPATRPTSSSPARTTSTVLGDLGLLRGLDHDRIPNLGLVDPSYLDLDYDRKNRWSAPARYGVYGFGYRRGVVTGKATGWDDFFDLVHALRAAGDHAPARADPAGRGGARRPRRGHEHRRRLDTPARAGTAARRPAGREHVQRRPRRPLRARRARAGDGDERRLRPRPAAAAPGGRHGLRPSARAAPRCGSTAG